ncbi:MAG: Cu(I)-responsive transcriptional regulator [Pseudogulbenkiania sp.]|nr:Cu(I)-responsive transcriptional regulator [Pseudogulbenkiania sp.]
MNIGEAANASGVSAKMIRYYESVGLIPYPHRTHSGYRVYRQEDVHVLRFIRRARDLGFPVEQIRELLALWQDRSRASSEVKGIARRQVEELNARIVQLVAMRDTLRHLVEHCSGDDRPSCPILDDLADAAHDSHEQGII